MADFCTACGGKVNVGDKFCPRCGNRIRPNGGEISSYAKSKDDTFKETVEFFGLTVVALDALNGNFGDVIDVAASVIHDFDLLDIGDLADISDVADLADLADLSDVADLIGFLGFLG